MVLNIKTFFFLGALAAAVHTAPALSQDMAIDAVLSDCLPTPPIAMSENYPGDKAFSTNNNLRRRTGEGWVASGEPIYIKGRVLDEDCLPVGDATVEVWHANPKGVYQDGKSGNIQDYDPYFIGAGKTLTNNLGQFTFLTVFPGPINETLAPRVHFRIHHPALETFETVMFFPEQPLNSEDPLLTKYRNHDVTLTGSPFLKVSDGRYQAKIEDQDLTYIFQITVPGKMPMKHY